MTGIVLLRAEFRCCSERIRDALGGAFIIGRESNAHMTIIQDRIIGPVSLFDLVQGLSDQIGADAIACHEGECTFKEVQPPERRKLIQHEEQFPAVLFGQIFRQPASNLVKDQPDQRLRPRQVGWRDDQIERKRALPFNQVLDAPVRPAGDFCDHGVTIKRQETHSRGQNPGALIL